MPNATPRIEGKRGNSTNLIKYPQSRNGFTVNRKQQGTSQKICPTYFELCLTYFKICQTYFLPAPNGVPQIRTNTAAFRNLTARKGLSPYNPNRSLGFVKLRAYARHIALRPAEGVAGYGEAGREDR